MKRSAVKSMKAITWLLILSVMGIWLISMMIMTIVLAQELYDRFYTESLNFTEKVFQDGGFEQPYEQTDLIENRMFTTIARNIANEYDSYGYYAFDEIWGYKSREKLIQDMDYPMENAIFFLDGDLNLLCSSEDEKIFFNYYTEEEWKDETGKKPDSRYGWIDIRKDTENLDDYPYSSFRGMYAGIHSLEHYPVLRVTGYWEGTELKPVIMHYANDTRIPEMSHAREFNHGEISCFEIASVLDRNFHLNWSLIFDRSSEYEGKKLVTVYLEYPKMWTYSGKTLSYHGKEYENLAGLSETIEDTFWLRDNYQRNASLRGIHNLNELIVFGGKAFADGEVLDAESEKEADFILVTVTRSHPLSWAIKALVYIYIITGLAALMLVCLVRNSIRRHLIQPVVDIGNAMETDWINIYYQGKTPVRWQEAEKLYSEYEAERDRRRTKENEIIRLNTALEYAGTAEQNRRQMISNIAHELKTPLAIIHSYAEGLKEHIAEEKRDKYIDVILSETERTDGMVLQMLDLSRLEAGRVKLSRDDVSLLTLARSVFEKLEIAAQAKKLQVDFSRAEDFMITVDESRITQVIENFATNAMKYTPVGGQIVVRIQKEQEGILFAIENESVHLSNEELSQVWDSFYRVDESRAGGGTGLGLAIAKSIIELHGGQCYVHNTKMGIEFGFILEGGL